MSSRIQEDVWWPFGVPPAGALGRLFCFPYAGAGASAYATWHRHAPQGLAVVPAQLPGREHRLKESAEPNLQRLIDKLAPAIEPFTHERYTLFGHRIDIAGDHDAAAGEGCDSEKTAAGERRVHRVPPIDAAL